MTEASPRHFNRVALVTGGRGGLGQAICARLAESGTTVVSVDAKNAGPDEALQHGTTGRVLQVTCDVSDRAAAHAMMERALANLGAVDVLVNCAGITRDSSLAKMTPEQWHDLMKVNLDSLFNLCQPAVAGMRAAGYGRIVNISSVNGQTGQFGQTNYAAAKAGVHGFTMALAREVAAHGITVNTIAPGYCDTPWWPPCRQPSVTGLSPPYRSDAWASRMTSPARWLSWPHPKPASSPARSFR